MSEQPKHRKEPEVPEHITIHVSGGRCVLNVVGSPMGGISVAHGDTVTIKNPTSWTVRHGA